MSDRERIRSRSNHDSNSRRDPRNDHGSRSREQSLDENSMLRLEMRAMQSRLKALEAKTKKSPLPGPSLGHMSVRSGDRDKDQLSAGERHRPASRRLQTPPQHLDRSPRLPNRRDSRSMRQLSPLRRRSISLSPAPATRKRDRRRSSRSRSRTPPSRSPRRMAGDSVRPSDLKQVTMADSIANAIRSISAVGKSSQHYYISNFDPNLHNIDDWCVEVDRAKELNGWSDFECLSRVGNCLKGDAKSWLDEWVSSDRSWTNFKREFRPLCPKVPDFAGILFDVMMKNSDNYPTYAEYVRRSLLRLRMVRGLSDELISAIIIRGITDPNIKASATNAKLLPNDLVEFFSIYVKPSSSSVSKAAPSRSDLQNMTTGTRSIEGSRKRSLSDIRCYSCGQLGHRQVSCGKKPRFEQSSGSAPNNVGTSLPPPAFVPTRPEPCSYCKKPGHKVETCFAKQRAEAASKDNVNFCNAFVPTGTS